MGFNSAFKGLKLLKNPGNGRLNNLNDPVLNVLILTIEVHTESPCTLICIYKYVFVTEMHAEV